MNPQNLAGLINPLGYTLGIALYAMLLWIVVRHPVRSDSPDGNAMSSLSTNKLLSATGVLGLLWNLGAFATYGLRGINPGRNSPVLSAIAFSALGFLPAVVVQSVLLNELRSSGRRISQLICIAAYALSASAALLQFYEAVVNTHSPSLWALRILTFGYLALVAILFFFKRRQEGWKKSIWAVALAVFAVSALHLSHHQGGVDPWYLELVGHHASLPLALAILYEDYRFAFADIFLKRAITLLVLIAFAFLLYVIVVSPLLAGRRLGELSDSRTIIVVLSLCVTTAIAYPWIRRLADRSVDRLLLRRANYNELRSDVAQLLSEYETTPEILDGVCLALTAALSARTINWQEYSHEDPGAENLGPATSNYVTLFERSGNSGAKVFVPTAEPPFYEFSIGQLIGGRRLLSDDMVLLESVALLVARRIDALRVTHERCEQSLREQEINKLVTEAQLRALRAQINPHFLFNALTTIGHLIQVAPERALETLMKLTSLLRSVLHTDGEFVTLGDELKLIRSYLDIERARFEERLRVSIEVPEDLLTLRIPSLLIQPLVENAIKHGITPSRYGGEVQIRAKLESGEAADQREQFLRISVRDSGIGASEIELVRGRRRGLGLNNVEERLHFYGGTAASLLIISTLGEGTMVEMKLPSKLSIAESDPSDKSIRAIRGRKEA